MIITEKDITRYFTTTTSELKLDLDGTWLTLEPCEDVRELTMALNYKWGIQCIIGHDGKIQELLLDRYKNVNPDLLEKLKDIRKENGVIEDEDE